MKRKGEEEKREEKEGGNGRGERKRRRETPSSLVEKRGKVSLAAIPALCRELAGEKERRTLLDPQGSLRSCRGHTLLAEDLGSQTLLFQPKLGVCHMPPKSTDNLSHLLDLP